MEKDSEFEQLKMKGRWYSVPALVVFESLMCLNHILADFEYKKATQFLDKI